MSAFATIVGLVLIFAASCVVIGLVLFEITSRIVAARELTVNNAIRDYSAKLGSRLRGDADWFSEDEATWKLVAEIAEGVRRGVSLDTQDARERWRKRRKEREVKHAE